MKVKYGLYWAWCPLLTSLVPVTVPLVVKLISIGLGALCRLPSRLAALC